jgi:tetratricopeptide (TPR) repeat protein
VGADFGRSQEILVPQFQQEVAVLMRLFLAGVLSASCLLAQTPSSAPRTFADADKLESTLESRPDDVATRVQLINFYYSQNSQTAERARPLQRKHVVWMIEHRPENPILASPQAFFSREDHEGRAAADAAWRKLIAAGEVSGEAQFNAASFYKIVDRAFARQLVDDGLKSHPENTRLAGVKGALLAYSVLGVKTLDQYSRGTSFESASGKSDDAANALHELEATTSPYMLGDAANALVAQALPLASRNLTDPLKLVEELAVKWDQRAIELDPNSTRWKSNLMSAWQSLATVKKSPEEKIVLLEKAAGVATGAAQRGWVLTELAQQYFNAGKREKAAAAANELVNDAGDATDWNYGNRIQTGNIILGRIALQQDNLDEARRRLLAAGRTTGSPQLNSFGPDWKLAAEMLGKGERDSVLSYIDLCRAFWKSGGSRLDAWAATIRDGGVPNFSGPAEIQRSRLLGTPALEFKLKNLEGGELSLSEFKGKVVLLDFWATWCGPCRAEMPAFQKIHRELSEKDVVVLALDVDEPPETVAEYVKKEHLTLPVLLAKNTGVVEKYGVNAFPTTFALDKTGKIADILVGGGTNDDVRLLGAIEKARNGAPPPAPATAPGSSTASASAASASTASLPPPSTAEDFYREATRMRGARDYTSAIKALDRALELRPDWLPAISQRASCFYQLKQYDTSLDGWNRAIELDPKRSQFYDERGLCYSYSGRQLQALSDYTRSIELNADNAPAYNNRGWAYLELGRLDEAEKDLDKCIELSPTHTLALKNRARLYMNRKQYAKAAADYEAVLRMSPSDTQASSGRMTALRLAGGGTSAAAAPPQSDNLAAPKPLSPMDGAVFDHFPRATTVVWAEVPGATSYVLEWDFDGGRGWEVDRNQAEGATVTVKQPVATFSFVGAQAGRWRVWAVDSSGKAGPKSEWRTFRYTR